MYTLLYTTRVCTPYTPLGIPLYPGAGRYVYTGSTMRGDDALGSTLGIVRDMRRREAFQDPKV